MAVRIRGEGGKTAGAAVPDRIALNDRFEIATGSPLPQFDSPPAVAYRAHHARDSSAALFALICDPKMPPRLDSISAFLRIDNRALLEVVESGIVEWAPEGRMCPAIVFRQPQADRVFQTLDETHEPMSEDRVTRFLISPLSDILKELHHAGHTHRAIRPNNLFFDDPNHNIIKLGEGISSPIASTQPVLFEPIDMGLAHPLGRGDAGPAPDLYALGVTILCLLIGRVPCRGLSDEDIISRKMDMGSYAALAENERISLTMMEPLRGLLNDDEHERWNIEDLSLWVSGRRLSPKQQSLPAKASRSIVIAGKEYSTARELARGLADNWERAIEPITNGELDTWLRRSLGDENIIEAVNLAKSAYMGSGREDDDRLISRIIIALHPEGPIRYRGFNATVEGLASLMAAKIEDSDACRNFSEIVRGDLPLYWLEAQPNLRSDVLPFVSQFDKLKPSLQRRGLGTGLERIAYDLNPRLPCLSPLFERDYVLDIEYLLPAYERLARDGFKGRRLIDQHVASFIAARSKRPLGNDFRKIENTDQPYVFEVAQIKLLSTIQLSLPKRSYPALCALAARMLAPAIKRFHGREARRQVKARLQKSMGRGRLKDILDVVDNRRELAQDKHNFEVAIGEYTKTVLDLHKLERDEQNRSSIIAAVGGQVSSIGATILFFLAVTIVVASSRIM